MSAITTTTFRADRIETEYVDGATARFAYRRMGPGLAPRWSWPFASERRWIIGIRRSSMCSPPTAT
jgi:hypothetical protein